MQDQSASQDGHDQIEACPLSMPRKPSKPHPRQGANRAALRRAAGLSQADLAKLVGDTQRNIAYWEQPDKPRRSDVVPNLAKVARLPRSQQDRIVEALVDQYKHKAN